MATISGRLVRNQASAAAWVSWKVFSAPEPKIRTALEEREIGGLGIYLAWKVADRVHYERRDEKNILTLSKQLPRHCFTKKSSCVILSPSPVTLSEAKGLGLRLRVNSAKDLVHFWRQEILRLRSAEAKNQAGRHDEGSYSRSLRAGAMFTGLYRQDKKLSPGGQQV